MKEKAEEYRAALLEHVAETDEELLEKYLGGEELTIDEIKGAIRKSTIDNTMVPVVCGTSYKNKGVQMLLDAIVCRTGSVVSHPSRAFHPLRKIHLQTWFL